MLTFKSFIRELTVSPDYRQGNTFNPFYDMSMAVTNEVSKQLKKKLPKASKTEKWKFKNIRKDQITSLKALISPKFGRGGYYFQITDSKDIETKYYIKTSKSNATGHFGMKTRKNSTASSNINELLSLYFLKYNTEKAGTESDAKAWLEGSRTVTSVVSKIGDTGIYKAESTSITYAELKKLLDADETPIKDVQIGWQNARAVEKDLGDRTVETYHWVPRNKPSGINKSNPSDIILCLSKRDKIYIGYSNKVSVGKDSTPKFNTNVNAFYSQLGDSTQLSMIQSIMDDAWTVAKGMVSGSAINATKVLNTKNADIMNADYTESNLKSEFADIGRAFNVDGLNFFGDDFYYPYRNYFITKFSEHLENADNLSYFLQTISSYTFATGGTPCPYKLLVGSTRSSTIKEVSSDELLKSILLSPSKYFEEISGNYDGTKQSFKLTFKSQDNNITIPITCRTRTSGGWQGKALYIETPGVKVT